MDLKNIQKLASDIFNLLLLLDNYCKQKSEAEEINNISTQVEILLHKADVLNNMLINDRETT